MKPIDVEKEIEFSGNRINWHSGVAVGGDLFYRTRTVIGSTATAWKVFLMPACFIGMPIYQVWHYLSQNKPTSAEEYDAFHKDILDPIKKLVEAYENDKHIST